MHTQIKNKNNKSCSEFTPFQQKASKQNYFITIKRFIMKKGLHPENYRLVAFKDMSNEDVFITKSTADTRNYYSRRC